MTVSCDAEKVVMLLAKCTFAPDVMLVIDGLLYVMRQHLENGEVVQVGDFGNFRMLAFAPAGFDGGLGQDDDRVHSELHSRLLGERQILFDDDNRAAYQRMLVSICRSIERLSVN